MILVLAGRMRSGKDTSADLLARELGFTKLSFAGDLKTLTARMLGIPREWADDTKMKETVCAAFELKFGAEMFKGDPTNLVAGPWGLSPAHEVRLRWFLQRLGEAACQTFGDDFWVERVKARLSQAHEVELGHKYVPVAYSAEGCDKCQRQYLPNAVVTDGRKFPEVEGMRAIGARVIRLNRADRTGRHEFIPLTHGDEKFDRCAYEYETADGRPNVVCDLPVRSHPTSWSESRHRSEVELPDDNPPGLPPIYDSIIETGSAEETAAMVLTTVRGWM